MNKELKVGLLVTIIGVMLYTGANFLKRKHLFSSDRIYYTTYENVKDLKEGNPITFNGLVVGTIQQIALAKNPHQIQVTLEVDKKVQVTDNTIARLESSLLLGNKNIELLIQEGEPLKQHSFVPGEIKQDLTTQFVENSSPALNDIKTITLLMSKFMQNMVENTDRINRIFAHLEHTSQQLDKAITSNQQHFSNISKNIAHIVDTLVDKEVGIEPMLTKTNLLLQEANNLQVNATITKLNDILTQLAEGPLYHHIDQTVLELNNLLSDLQSHPGKYVHFSIFGSNSIANNSTRSKLPSPAQNNTRSTQALAEKVYK